jgi:hypothetical protein
MLRVIEATRAEMIAEVERKQADHAERADDSNPKGARTAKERDAHQMVADALAWAIELLQDWKVLPDGEEIPTEPPANGAVPIDRERARREAAGNAAD